MNSSQSQAGPLRKIVDYHLDERLDWVADLEVRASAVHTSQSAVDRIIHDEFIMTMPARRGLINGTAGWPVGSTFRVPAVTFRERIFATFGPNCPWCSHSKCSHSLRLRSTNRRRV